MRQALQALGSIPGGRWAQVEAARTIVLMTSNVRGPSRPIPIPRRSKVDEHGPEDGSYELVNKETNGKEEREGFTPIFFGMAVPGLLPINFTLVSYNDLIRVGLITNVGSVEDPQVLMDCFVEEWNEYDAKSKQ